MRRQWVDPLRANGLFCQRFRLAWLQGRFPAPVLPGERTGPLLRDWLPASLTKWSGPRGGGLLLQGSGRSVPDSVTGIAPTPRQAGEKGWLLNRCKRDDKPLAPVELHIRVRRATGIGLFSCHAYQFLSNRVVVSCHGFILPHKLSIVNNLRSRLNRPWYRRVSWSCTGWGLKKSRPSVAARADRRLRPAWKPSPMSSAS